MSRASPLVALSIACATLAVLLASVSTGVLAQPSGGGGAQQMDLGALFGALGAMQGGGGAGGGVGGKQAKKQPMCASGTLPVQAQKPLESNGCSKPEFMKIDGEEDFTYCCDRHDACYGICGIEKQYCEDQFKSCLQNMCHTAFKTNPKCIDASNTYVMGVSMFGGGAFEETQRGGCKCVAPDAAIPHYRQLIHDFYQSYAPEKLEAFMAEKFDKYTTNAGTAKKPKYSMMQRLYLELHNKYDAAIKHVDGRVGRTPPRPLATVAEAAVESPAAHVAADVPDAVVRKREL